jgi:hypothetical protein
MASRLLGRLVSLGARRSARASSASPGALKPRAVFLGVSLARVLALRIVIRPLSIIIAALLLSRPSMPRSEAVRYATALQHEAKEHDFDPLTGVAIIHRESHWLPQVVSADSEDYGLAQIRARYVGACRSDADPIRAPSEACRRVQQSLLDGAHNIHVMATLITRNREHCKQKTGTALFDQWLASYEGRNYPGSDKWCQSTEQTMQVIRYRRWLIDKVVAKRGSGTEPTAGREAAARRGKQRVKPKAPARGTPARARRDARPGNQR